MTENKEKIAVLFVCMGNICRSPTAEGVFRHLVNEAGMSSQIEVDSAGTHAYHVAEPADKRARSAAENRGMSLDGIKARRVCDNDFVGFDYIIAMDEDNVEHLIEQAPAEYQDRIQLFLSYTSLRETAVPDPYYGGATGFERVLDLVEVASRDLLATLIDTHRL